MKRLAVCLAVVAPLALPGAAAAKEVVAAKVCGASDCRTVKDREALLALHEGGAPTDPPPASAFFRVELTVRGDGELFTFPIAIVPDAGLVRGGTEAEGYAWMAVSQRAVREFREMTRGMEPYPAGRLGGLEPPEARVDEVVAPPPPAEPQPDGGMPLWPWLIGALAALGVAMGVRRRRAGPGSPEPAGG